MAGQRERLGKTRGSSWNTILANKPQGSVVNALTGEYERPASILGSDKGKTGEIGQSLKDFMLASADKGSSTDPGVLQKFVDENIKESGQGLYQISLNGRDTVWLSGNSKNIDDLKVVDFEEWKKKKK
jgi:hypothetical protein